VAGGSPTLVCPAPNGADLSWSAKGVILLDGANADSLRMVPAGGGELRPATRVNRTDHESGSAWPCFLPDGEHFVFCGIRTDGSAMNIRLGKLGTLDSKLLGRSDGRVEVAPGGWLVYLNGSAVVAQKLDLGAGKLTGERLTLVDDVRVGTSAGHFSFSRDGVFAVQHAGATAGLEMHLANRAGVVQPAVLTRGDLWNPRLSPDGTRVLYDRHAGTSANWGEVGVVDLTRGTDTQLTFTNTLAVGAQWSPDGKRIAYTKAPPDAKPRLVIEPADGLGAQDSVIAPGSSAYLSQWAAAGSRLIAFTDDGAALAVASDGGERALKPLAAGLMTLGNPQVSPDGRWVCGSTGTSPNIAIFVQSLEQPSGRWQVSASGGGYKPRWTKGGREVVYESLDQKLMAVDIDTSGGFHAGMPHVLFSLPAHPALPPLSIWTCDEAGERFVVLTPSNAQAVGATIEIATDFGSLVHRK
jgi:Tol biopolymer transport system component